MDSGAGVEVRVKMGDEVEKGEPVARLYDGWGTERAGKMVREALKFSDEPVEPAPGILDSL